MDTRFATILIFMVCGATSIDAQAAPTPEQIFETASKYTVRVKSRIEYAFGEDSAGAFSGTGFVIDARKGWIVTNRHVVGESPSDVQIAVKDGQFVTAKKLYVDPVVDIAILEAAVDGATSATMSCDHPAPGTGHPVGAYGHPWGLIYTGTQGVISGRVTKWAQIMLQTDAPINSGNSGGPLISMRDGRVVGVNTSSYSEDDAQNTNFAVPINDVCVIVSLLERGLDPSPPDLPAAFFKFEDREDVVVARVFDNTMTLDLAPYDRIIAAGPNFSPVNHKHDLTNALRGNLDRATVKILRDGEEMTISGSLRPLRIKAGVEFSGIVLAPYNFIDKSITPAGHDIGVYTVTAGSRGSGKGLKWFDLVYKVDGVRVTELAQLFVLLSNLEEDSTVSVEFLRVLEDEQYFGYIQRDMQVEPPLWLDNEGASQGVDIQLSWIASELEVAETSENSDYRQLSKSIARLSRQVDDGALSLDPEQEELHQDLRRRLAMLPGDRVQAADVNKHSLAD